MKKIYTEDIIYHYTKASTAIDFILYNGQLRFNSSRNSNDPIESRKPRRGIFYTGGMAGEEISRDMALDSTYINNHISNLENQFHQICFCKNHYNKYFNKEYLSRGISGYEELFGFTKVRMWDQYADNYSGVCLAFSKEKIITKNERRIELLKDDVKYLSFQKLSDAKIGDINGNYLSNIGKNRYKKLIDKQVKKSLFFKHKDYRNENEYRIGTFYDKDKCCLEIIRGEFVFEKTMMLDISDCVEAIFISSYLNDKQKSELLAYANKLNIPIIEIRWQYDSFELIDYKGELELIKNLFDPQPLAQ